VKTALGEELTAFGSDLTWTKVKKAFDDAVKDYDTE
jgi:hypothetical protein